MHIAPREDWQDPAMPVTGVPMALSSITLLPCHYTAAATIPSDIPAYLRSIQRDYTLNRGYSIGYNFAIDQTGKCWELRGFDFRCAANKGMNHLTVAVLCLVDGAEPMNGAMVQTFKALAMEAEWVTGRRLDIVGHRDIGATACPGDGIYNQVVSGVLDPNEQPQPKPPKTGDDMATAILHIEGRNAQFVGQGPLNPDGSVHCLFITWLGPGPSHFVDDHTNAPDTVHQPTLIGTLARDLVLLGNPEDIDDGTGPWSEADFYRVIRS